MTANTVTATISGTYCWTPGRGVLASLKATNNLAARGRWYAGRLRSGHRGVRGGTSGIEGLAQGRADRRDRQASRRPALSA
jgi:hypothetical protein